MRAFDRKSSPFRVVVVVVVGADCNEGSLQLSQSTAVTAQTSLVEPLVSRIEDRAEHGFVEEIESHPLAHDDVNLGWQLHLLHFSSEHLWTTLQHGRAVKLAHKDCSEERVLDAHITCTRPENPFRSTSS